MNKQGETEIGGIIIFAFAMIVGLVFIAPIFSQQAVMTTAYTNTQTAQAIPTAATALIGQELLTAATIVNQSGASIDCSGNFSISEGVDTVTNTKRVLITPVLAGTMCTKLNYTYSYGAEGYVDDTGGRAIAGNIGLFAVLALLGAAIYYFVKNNGGLFNF